MGAVAASTAAAVTGVLVWCCDCHNQTETAIPCGIAIMPAAHKKGYQVQYKPEGCISLRRYSNKVCCAAHNKEDATLLVVSAAGMQVITGCNVISSSKA
jgi:hypothetical protein